MMLSILVQLSAASDSVAAVANTGVQPLPALFVLAAVLVLLVFLIRLVIKKDEQPLAVPVKSAIAEKSTQQPKSTEAKSALSTASLPPALALPEVISIPVTPVTNATYIVKPAIQPVAVTPPPVAVAVPLIEAPVPQVVRVISKATSVVPPVVIQVAPPVEDTPRGQIKYIGYHPVNVFAQTEPIYFPYVLLPTKEKCVVKFPRQGRVGRRGYKEADFLTHLTTYFQQAFNLYNDRLLLVKEGVQPFEPDITLIDERNGLNLFIDIEIDEPYEGTNDIATRQPMHYQAVDSNRNNAFRNRGWAVIRFAVYASPD